MRSETTELNIHGMICQSCVGEVEMLLLHTRGVLEANVSYLKRCAQITYDPELAGPDTIRQRLEENGYEVGGRSIRDFTADILCLPVTGILAWLLLGGSHQVPELGTQAGFGAAFLAGLVTSPHCLGMCGGILLGTGVNRRSPAIAALAYNSGRVLAYTGVGAVFGAMGAVITYSMSIKSMVFTLAGIAVAWMGLHLWGLLPGLGALLAVQGSACRLPQIKRERFAGKPLVIGLLTGLMPCGSLYALWLHAVSGGSAAYGAESMLAFALGTVPLMLAFGALGSIIPKKWNRYFLKVSAVLVTAMGIKMLVMGLRMR